MLRPLLFIALPLAACKHTPPTPPPVPEPPPIEESSAQVEDSGPALPEALQAKVTVLGPDDPDFPAAALNDAVKPQGDGGLSGGLALRLEQDLSVYRMWSGPEVIDERGNTNRMGQWWSFDAPQGSQADYRVAYEVCEAWNELTWVVECTLSAGAVVSFGPGQSVSAMTCGDPSGQESYPANDQDWQVYIAKAWERAELVCPEQGQDYAADLQDLSQPAAP